MGRLVCATHGHCFDGLASATLLTELVSEINRPSQVDYLACGYGPSRGPLPLDGDENALLDFRYEAAATLTYYFDHHTTAFRSRAEQDHFEAQVESSESRFVWDPTAVSCTGLLARHAQEKLGIDLSRYAELIRWADKIDGAQFSSAEEATDRKQPIMRLTAVIERFGDSEFLGMAVPILRAEGLTALSEARFVKDLYRNIGSRFRDYERRVRERGALSGRVAMIDLSEKPVTVVAKFAQYRAFPDALYSVILSSLGGGWKISAGYNPWSGAELDTNIGEICARYGGGGHPVVGAVSFAPDQAGRAREVTAQIVSELQTPAQS